MGSLRSRGLRRNLLGHRKVGQGGRCNGLSFGHPNRGRLAEDFCLAEFTSSLIFPWTRGAA